MNRFIKKLKSYPSNLTLKQLITKVKEEEDALIKIGDITVNRVKKEFKDSYFKSEEDSVFGRVVVVLHIVEIVSSERTTDWELVYNIKGTALNFCTVFLSKRNLTGKNTTEFCKTEENLKKRTRITKEQYRDYSDKFEHIISQIKNI